MPHKEIQLLADEELMHLVQQGDTAAFETMYDRHGGAAFSLAYRMSGDRTTAEEIVQEAFLATWRSAVRYQRTRGSVRSWLLSIVHHRSVDALRRNGTHERRRATSDGLEEREDPSEPTDVQVARRDEAQSIRAAMNGLPEAQSRVIQLAYFGGFTHTEIAEMLEMPIGTVKGRMRLGLEKMRRQLLEGAA